MNLDREKARGWLRAMRESPTLDLTEQTLDRLEGCVVEDPRLARIAALPAEVDPNGLAWLSADDVAEILGGGPA